MTHLASRQQGAALIVALLIVAIVSIMGTEMASRLQLQVKRASNIKDNNQAYWYAMGAEQFARKSIQQLLKDNKEVINLEQPWTEEVTYPLEGGGINAQLSDRQTCFNLNALAAEPGNNNNDNNQVAELAAFERLLTNAEIDISSYEAEVMRDSLADWVDGDSQMRTYGAEDSHYEALVNPYLAANALLVNKSELRLINGVEQKWLAKLLPLVCALPDNKELKINVNTIDEEHAAVLSAITGIAISDAKSIISNRDPKGYETIEEFLQEPEITAQNLNDKQKSWLDIKTEYFHLRTKTRYNNATFFMSSLFRADENQNVSVIRREFAGVE